jgi:hypothetical protein
MNKKSQQLVAFGAGIVFIIVLFIMAILFPNPAPFQFFIFRTILSLAAAGFAAMVPGFLQVRISNLLRASGAIAVFVIVYFYNPANLAISKPHSVGAVQYDFSKINRDTTDGSISQITHGNGSPTVIGGDVNIQTLIIDSCKAKKDTGR